ncbi:MAG TPA: diacylglycerol kinase family protein [Acidimicrobiales bacterium]|nr:diacylglycerol kinase family protein [Acidimicrobiales bacterium]
MAAGRFLRRAVLRGALAGAAARPLGGPAAAAGVATGALQEHAALGVVAAAAATAWVRRHRRDQRLALRLAAGVAAGLATRLVWPVASKEPASVRAHRTVTSLPADPVGEGVGIVVNPSAGSGAVGGEGSPATALRAALPAARVVELAEGGDLVAVLEELVGAGCRAIGVAGGDGSINTAAGVALEHGLPLVVVPAGTLNHLARDLGVESLDDAVDAVRAGHAAVIDVGWIAGRPFLNTASFGGYVELVDAREALEDRVGKWAATAVALVRVLRRGSPVRVVVDGEERVLWLAFLGNCRYHPPGVAPTWRERLDDGQIDVRLVDASQPFARARLVAAALTGTLRRSRVLETFETTTLHVRSPDGPLRLARDGETFDGPDEVVVVKDGSRLTVYTPQRS